MSNSDRAEQLRAEIQALQLEATAILDKAEAENRDLSEEEAKEYDARVMGDDCAIKRKQAELARLEASPQVRPQTEQREVVPETEPDKPHARAKDPASEERTYRPDLEGRGQVSFLRDLLAAKDGNPEARERLARNHLEAIAFHSHARGWSERDAQEYRDNTAGSTTGSEFFPPLYLGDLYVEPNIASRPLANALPKYPLPPTGVAITIPKLSSGVAVAARSDGGTVQETDAVTATVSHDVNEIAGQVDIGRQLVMRTDPGFDTVIVRTLRRRYDAYLDTQLFSGSGTAPQHRGLDNITSPNSLTWTQTTPTSAAFLGALYDGIQQIQSNRFEVFADLIVMHPRRAAWANATLSSTVPLFQQGQLVQAVGTQNGGFAQSLGGIPILFDPNITTTAGNPGTNQDKVYILAKEDFYLAEGPLMARVFEDVGSGTGVIRFQAFAFSAFLSNRYPKSLSIITGSGLASPAFGY